MNTSTIQFLARLSGAVVVAACAACSGVAGNATAPTPVSRLAPAPVARSAAAPSSLRQQIVTEIGAAPCDNSAQCRTLALGHRACGGPEAYLAFSTKSADGEKLQRLATQERADRAERDTRSGMISTCQLVVDPGATCASGRCLSGNASSAGLPTR